MDSVTQFVLGAAVGAATLGPRIGPRKAAIAGGLLGTLPDLDVLFPFDDPIDSFTLHRGPSHSFFVQALAAPLVGEAVVRLFKGLCDQRLRTYLAVYLIFATHAVIDALTIYGTRVFWPLIRDPVGTGSVFIIDPLYSLPLLFVVVWAFVKGTWSRRFGLSVVAALALSTAYMGWGLAAQQVVKARAASLLADAGVVPDRLMASPTPFNTLFWKAIAVDGERYINLYIPVFGSREAVTAYVHPRGTERLNCLEGSEALAKLAAFSDGFFRIDVEDGDVVVSDLRMGMTPNYVFRFAVAQETADGLTPMAPERRETVRSTDGDTEWLLANLSGESTLRPAEALMAVNLAKPVRVAEDGGTQRAC